MLDTWQNALDAYQYDFDLKCFQDAANHPGWFDHSTRTGNRAETIEFEDRFRRYAPDNLEVWYEVVFWKLSSQEGRRDGTTQNVIRRLTNSRTTAGELWELTEEYIERPSRGTFKKLRSKFFTSDVVATVATFPAFICPERFPMVDTHVAKWARANGSVHSYAPISGPEIVKAPKLDRNKTVVKESDWEFVSSWVEWCRFTADQLSKATGSHWRARDVEMAVFTADLEKLTLRPLMGHTG